MTVERGEGRPAKGAYIHDGVRVPSVTQILGCFGEPDGLMHWACKHAVIRAAELALTPDDCARRSPRYWESIRASNELRDSAGDHGTRVHEAIEALWEGSDIEVPRSVDAIDLVMGVRRVTTWMETQALTPIATELRFTSDVVGGTADWIFRDDSTGAIIIGDLKTGKSPSETWLMQLGAYCALYESNRGEKPAAAFALHVPRAKPDQPARAYWVEGEGLRIARRAFGRLAEAYHLADQLRVQVGKKPRIKITAPAA